jgi:hypothetical protein
MRGRDSSVIIGTDYGMDGQGLIPGKGTRFFSSAKRPDRLWGPPSLLYNGYLELFPRELKRLGSEADCSAPSSADLHFLTRLHGAVLN